MQDYLKIAREISTKISDALISHLAKNGYNGIVSDNAENSKATHQVDKIASEVVINILQDVPCRIFMESFQYKSHPNPRFSIFIDPVDGSINWDRGIGDPGVCIAISNRLSEIRYKDIEFVYVRGLRTGDIYCYANGEAWYENKLTAKNWPLKLIKPIQLSDAMGYLKTGYGGARKQLDKTLPLFELCKDIRAIDNSAMELAELSRGATNFIVDARDLSDGYNLLAYPMINYSGGKITTLDGVEIGELELNPNQIINFVAASDHELHNHLLELIK